MIEAARRAANGSIEKQLELLVEALSQEAAEDIIEFDRILDDMQDKAYRANIWEAGYFIYGMGGDSVFMDFRSWLIAQGEEIFEKAIENPDSLAAIVDAEHREDFIYERFGYVGSYAYRRKMGEDAEIPYAPRERPQFIGDIHDEEEWPQLYPALMAKLGSYDRFEDKGLDDCSNKVSDDDTGR